MNLKWDKILKIAFGYYLSKFIIEIINYVFDRVISSNTTLSFSTFFLEILLIFFLCKSMFEEDEPNIKKWSFSIGVALLISGFFSLGNVLILHQWLDTNYKNKIVDAQIEQKLQQIREVEKEKNVEIKFNTQNEEKKLLANYKPKTFLFSFFKNIPFYFLFGFLISKFLIIILDIKNESKRKQKKPFA